MNAEERKERKNERRRVKRVEKRKHKDMTKCKNAAIEVGDRARCVLCWNTSDLPPASRPNIQTRFQCKRCDKHYCLTESKTCMLQVHADTPDGKELRKIVAMKTRPSKVQKQK